MADRSLRGMRLGTQSLQSEVGVEFSPRKKSTYRAADGTTFEVVFAADAEVPQQWESPKTGQEGILLDSDGELTVLDEQPVRAARVFAGDGVCAVAEHGGDVEPAGDLLEDLLGRLRAGLEEQVVHADAGQRAVPA